MTGRPTFDLPEIYREGRQRLLALAPTLSAEQLRTLTPTCPEWTVQDIYAHLTGLAAEIVGGRIEGRGSSERTAIQVGSRRGHSIAEICDEWRSLADDIDGAINAAGRVLTPLAVDIWTHEQDLANAAGVESGRDGTGLPVTMNAAWATKAKLREAGIPPLRFVAGRVDWVIGDGDPGTTVRMSEYEMARAVLGRRSRAQLAAYHWEGDPDPYVEHMTFFDTPEYDIVE